MDPIGRVEALPVPLGSTDQQPHPSRLAGIKRSVDQQVTSELVNLKAQNVASAEIHEQVVFSPESSAMLQKVTAPEVDLTTPEKIAARLKVLVEENTPKVALKAVPAEEPQGQALQSEALVFSTPDNDKTYAPPRATLTVPSEIAVTLANLPAQTLPEEGAEKPAQRAPRENVPGNQSAQPPRTTVAPETQATAAPLTDAAGAITGQPGAPLTNAPTVPAVVVQQAILTEFGSPTPQIPASEFTPLIKDGIIQPQAHFNQPDGLIPARPGSSASLVAENASNFGLSPAIKDARPARSVASSSGLTGGVIKDAVELPVETTAQQTLAAKVLSRLALALNETGGTAAAKISLGPADGQSAPSQNQSALNAENNADLAAMNIRLPAVESRTQAFAGQMSDLLGAATADASSRLAIQSRTPEHPISVGNNVLPQDAREERAGATVTLADLPFCVNSAPPSRAHMRIERFDEQERGGNNSRNAEPKQTYSISLELQTPDVGLVKVRLAYTGAELNGTVIFCTGALAEQAQQQLNDLRSVLRQVTGIEQPVILMRAEDSGYQAVSNSL